MNPAIGRIRLGAALVALWSALLAAPGGAVEEGPLFSTSAPRFAADVASTLRPDGGSSLQVTIQIPYTQLQFIRVPAGYGAAVEFVVVLRAKKSDREGGDAWEERFVVGRFEDTRDPNTQVSVARRFEAEPGKYRLRVQARDRNGGRVSAAEREVEVRGLGEGALGLADLVFGECPTGADTSRGFLRNASRRYTAALEQFCVRSGVYDRGRSQETVPYELHYRILDENGRTELEGDTLLARGSTSFLLRPDVTELFLGTYRLELEVREGKRKGSTEGTFDIEAITVPRGTQWAMMLEILSYVATGDALRSLRDAETEEERRQAWNEFWERRDPTPETVRNEALIELMRRIRYANSNFQGFGQGWRTDQGRIYIRYGAPDQIEDLAATHAHPPLQIWHYFEENRRFVFADRDGFGRYELVNVFGP